MQNRICGIMARDFLTIPSSTFQRLIGFVGVELGRRRSVASSVVRRAFLATGRRARYRMRDRDGIYGDEFKSVLKGLSFQQLITAHKAPLQNTYAERVIGTIRSDCLDRMIVLEERHARRLLEEYVRYSNTERAHQALDGEPPLVQSGNQVVNAPVRGVPYLGGLHHGYRGAG